MLEHEVNTKSLDKNNSFNNNFNELNDQLENTTLNSNDTISEQSIFDQHQTLKFYKHDKYKINNINVLDLIYSVKNIEKAIEIFAKAAEREKVGKMNDAVRYYRESIKIYSNIEIVYRKKLQYEYAIETYYKNLNSSNAKTKESVDKKSKKNVELLEEDEEKKPCLLTEMLPISILNKIAIELFEMNQEYFINFISTCSFLNTNCFHNNSLLFKRLAEKVYEHQFYDTDVSLRLTKQEKNIEDAWQISTFYKGDYKQMLQQRPYIKFQGVYISVNNYIRQGGQVEGSSNLFNPIHMVTYYRYFRFMPNGDVIRLVTTDEPAKVVKVLKYGLKESVVGKWSINIQLNNLLTVERFDASGDKCIEQFIISDHTKRLPHNKLVWDESYYIGKDGEGISFRLKNEKNFYFSRVRSYPIKVDTLM